MVYLFKFSFKIVKLVCEWLKKEKKPDVSNLQKINIISKKKINNTFFRFTNNSEKRLLSSGTSEINLSFRLQETFMQT